MGQDHAPCLGGQDQDEHQDHHHHDDHDQDKSDHRDDQDTRTKDQESMKALFSGRHLQSMILRIRRRTQAEGVSLPGHWGLGRFVVVEGAAVSTRLTPAEARWRTAP